MFLIRTAFWLTLLILILPTNEGEQRQVFGAAEATVKDLGSFCSRNPDVCERGRSAFDNFGQKAQFGAKMLMNFIEDASEGVSADDRGAPELRAQAPLFGERSKGTLTDNDLRPAWSTRRRDEGV